MLVDVVIIRSNPIANDPRVSKIASSISKKYSVAVLGWNREVSNKYIETPSRRLQFKLFKIRAPYGRVSLLAFYPLFWVWIFYNLVKLSPKIVHACDLDTVIPSYFFKLFFSRKLVFDSFDRYAMAYIPPNFFLIYQFFDALENIIASKVDALVTVSEERLSLFGNYKPNNYEIILNCPDKMFVSDLISVKNPSKHKLTLVYAGSLANDRGVFILNEAISGLEDVELILAGRIDNKDTFNILRNPNIRYIGLLTYNEALKLQSSADIIPLLYDPIVPINRVASPNKLFEAMLLGVPVISNVCPNIIQKERCGLIVKYSATDIRSAILFLKENSSLRAIMAQSGRLAAQEKYNWSLMENKLMKLYSEVLTN